MSAVSPRADVLHDADSLRTHPFTPTLPLVAAMLWMVAVPVVAAPVTGTHRGTPQAAQQKPTAPRTTPPAPDGELKATRQKAAQGDAAAQNDLGVSYQNGQGVPRDDAEAVKWYRKAAEQGLAQAQYNLGWMYGAGQGLPRDDKQAVEWFRLAAEQGHAPAQYQLGLCYSRGQGVVLDYAEAYKWFSIAAVLASGYVQTRSTESTNVLTRTMTPAQLAEAQKRAQAWIAAYEKRKK